MPRQEATRPTGHLSITSSGIYLKRRRRESVRLSAWRCNLTALSQHRNLYFVGCGSDIHVYEPYFPSQALANKPVLILATTPTAEARPGFIDPRRPHAINSLLVSDLGNEEIVVAARDDGDVDAFWVRHIVSAIDLRTQGNAEAQATLGIRATELRPFFQRNVGASAWGLAVHTNARLIAASCNTHELNVFALGPTGVTLRTLNGHANIPHIAFCNTGRDPDGTFLLTTDIRGDCRIVDLHAPHEECRFSCRPDAEIRDGPYYNFDRVYAGWIVAFLDPCSFRPVASIHEALGVPDNVSLKAVMHPHGFWNANSSSDGFTNVDTSLIIGGTLSSSQRITHESSISALTEVIDSSLPSGYNAYPDEEPMSSSDEVDDEMDPGTPIQDSTLRPSDEALEDLATTAMHDTVSGVERSSDDLDMIVDDSGICDSIESNVEDHEDNGGVPLVPQSSLNSPHEAAHAGVHVSLEVPETDFDNDMVEALMRDLASGIQDEIPMIVSNEALENYLRREVSDDYEDGLEENSTIFRSFRDLPDSESVMNDDRFSQSPTSDHFLGSWIQNDQITNQAEENDEEIVEDDVFSNVPDPPSFFGRSRRSTCRNGHPPCPVFHASIRSVWLLQPLAPRTEDNPFQEPFIRLYDPFRQIPSLDYDGLLEDFDRINMFAEITSLGAVVIASQSGRAAVLSLTRCKGLTTTSPLPPERNHIKKRTVYAFRLEHILPTAAQERAGERPLAPLIGIATSPVQGSKSRWRLLMYYLDHSLLAYEIARNSSASDVDLDIATIIA